MDILTALFLGAVQGATEFLPVSSSGHLFLAEMWLGLTTNVPLMIATHVATLGAVLVVFWRQVWSLVVGFFRLCLGERGTANSDQGVVALKLGVATILTVLVALVIEPFFGELLTLQVVASTLIITGGLILIAEKFRPQKIQNFTWTVAIFLGLVQGFAVIPGISRSGLTIAFLILLGLQRRRAAELSFLLSIPTILAAGLYALKDIEPGTSIDVALLAACGAAFFTGLVMIYSMLKLVEKHWIWFAPYCVGLGLFLLFF